MTDIPPTPRLSVVLATDAYPTIRPVLAALRRQSCAREIEPVIVLLGGAARDVRPEDLSAFPHARVLRSVDHLPRLAPWESAQHILSFVFIGETHSYPQSGWAAALLTAFEGPWAAVVPCDRQCKSHRRVELGVISVRLRHVGAKPSLRRDLGSADLQHRISTGGAVVRRRQAFRSLGSPRGDALASALDAEDIGRRVCLRCPNPAPQRRNIQDLIREKFCVGVVLGTHRAARWSPFRRLLYFLGSPLIPIVLFARVLRGARHWPSAKLPTGAIAGV